MPENNTGIQELFTGRTVDDPNGFAQSEYDFTSRVFPEDLGSSQNGHYMVININVPVNADGDTRSSYNDVTGSTGSRYSSSIMKNEFSKVDNLRFGNTEEVFGAETNAVQRELYALRRGTRRIKESIALHMPTPVIYSSMNAYEEISMTSIAGQVGRLGASGLGTVIGAFMGGPIGGLVGGGIAGSVYDAIGNKIGQVSSMNGTPINPRVEVLFATTPQRQFSFEVLMAPKNQNESRAIKGIVESLRFHAAPELSSIGIIPSYVPPAEFDVTFYMNGQENTNMPRINTCVMERIDVDYAPTGIYSSFSNGHPVAVRLSFAMREIEIVHKRRVLQGF